MEEQKKVTKGLLVNEWLSLSFQHRTWPPSRGTLDAFNRDQDQDLNFFSIQTLPSCSSSMCVCLNQIYLQKSPFCDALPQLKVAHPTQKVENEGTGVGGGPQWGVEILSHFQSLQERVMWRE